MQITKQLALFLENRPGTLARVCDALSAAKINIYAISTSDTVDHSVVRMVVNDPVKALFVFEEHGTLVVEDDVLMITGDNKPGSLANLAETYEGELDNALRVMTNMIEPVIICVMALGVGFLLVSVLSALFSITSSINAGP